MKRSEQIAVLGGAGRTGKFVVNQLLKRGYSLKVLIRTPENFKIHDPSINVIQGDALDPQAVRSLIAGCDAVVSTIGQRKDEPLVSSSATSNVLAAMKEHGVTRYIAVAGLNVDAPFDKKNPKTLAASEWMRLNFPTIHADRQKAYERLSSSNVNWTLIRVPWIVFEDAKGEVSVSMEDCPGEKITAGDISVFIADQLLNDAYFQKAPFIADL